jgi:hypothetical protein
MEIHMLLLDGQKNKEGYVKPDKQIFKGNYALETCILKLIETYYGPKLKDKIEDILGSSKEIDIQEAELNADN